MTDLALLIVRVTHGALLAGHGAQKLFGSFGGFGLKGTAGWLESMGMRPGTTWASLAGISEFGGGVLTALGFLNPIGPLMGLGSMVMASVKVHAGKPIWVTSGGAELPVTNMAIQVALIVAGPGRFSLDRLLGIRLPRLVVLPALGLIVASVAYATREAPAPDEAETQGGMELQAGGNEPILDAAARADTGTPSQDRSEAAHKDVDTLAPTVQA
jgi:putative oxidoreductase